MEKQVETILGHTVVDFLPVEWIKYTMFHIEEKYLHVPMLVFRLIEKDNKFEKFVECINAFEGNSKWVVFRNPFSRKENYILSIYELKEMYQIDKEELPSQREYFGDGYEKICDNAISDIVELTEHIKNWFAESDVKADFTIRI